SHTTPAVATGEAPETPAAPESAADTAPDAAADTAAGSAADSTPASTTTRNAAHRADEIRENAQERAEVEN
ncbi:MAG TPA: hypothetical protein DCM55_05050, partial [Corynebacterium variabile]|nr:hypothetical protein [Corynebacterium variabile]